MVVTFGVFSTVQGGKLVRHAHCEVVCRSTAMLTSDSQLDGLRCLLGNLGLRHLLGFFAVPLPDQPLRRVE